MVVHECKICGRKFETSGRKCTCSEECRELNLRQLRTEERRKLRIRAAIKRVNVNNKGLNLILTECAELGVSYGVYMQLRDTGRLDKYKKDNGYV